MSFTFYQIFIVNFYIFLLKFHVHLQLHSINLLNLLEQFKQKQITLISLKEDFNFNTSTGKLLLTLLVALTEMERDLLLERQREGIALAKARGAYKGRKSIPIPDNFHQCLQMYLNRENNYQIKHFIRLRFIQANYNAFL